MSKIYILKKIHNEPKRVKLILDYQILLFLSDTQRLLLNLHSKNTSGGGQGAIWNAML